MISVRDIQQTTAAYFRLAPLEMVSERRGHHAARARQIAMYLSRHHLAMSLPRIGKAFGNRDHTTVIHALRRIEGLRERDAAVAGALRDLRAKLGLPEVEPLPAEAGLQEDARAKKPWRAPDEGEKH